MGLMGHGCLSDRARLALSGRPQARLLAASMGRGQARAPLSENRCLTAMPGTSRGAAVMSVAIGVSATCSETLAEGPAAGAGVCDPASPPWHNDFGVGSGDTLTTQRSWGFPHVEKLARTIAPRAFATLVKDGNVKKALGISMDR